MAIPTGRDALLEALESHARECLQKLESYKEVEMSYRAAVRALKAFGVGEPAKTKGGARAGAGRPRVSPGGAGKGTGYRAPGTTIGDQVEALLRKHVNGMTVAELAAELPKGTPYNSIHSAFRSIKGRRVKLEMVTSERAGKGQQAGVYRIKA